MQFYFIEHMAAFYHLLGDYFLAKSDELIYYSHQGRVFRAILYPLKEKLLLALGEMNS